MTAIVMQVKHAMEHPNADALRLYTMSAPGRADTQIVANLENTYEAGDHAVVVFAGSILKDGTKIHEARVRGIASYGMALGKTDLAVGTDVSDDHCKDQGDGLRMIRWPSIESLFNIRRNMAKAGTERKITYLAKVKLDGTNAGVQVAKDGTVAAQSRTKIITPEDDNMSFAKWVESRKDYFSSLATDEHLVIFGEWCGKGIQKGTAIAQLDGKVFVIFAIQYGGVNGEPSRMDINPVTIYDVLGEGHPDDIRVLSFFGDPIQIDFTNVDILKLQAEELNKIVAEVEACDPWVKNTFDIEGIGEGIVMYPLPDGVTNPAPMMPIIVDPFEYSELVFKAKGEKHKVVKTKQPVQIDPEVAKNIDEFVALFVTEARLNQIADKTTFEPKNTGLFLKEFSQDVQKESIAELEASGLTWKQIAKGVSTAARTWFINKCKEL